MATIIAARTCSESSSHVNSRIHTATGDLAISAVLGVMLFASGQPAAPAQTLFHAVTRSDVADQNSWYDSVEAYKHDAARHVVRKNKANTFNGRLPPMLPAVVVLIITVDETGRTTEVSVQRSPDDEASAVAIASIYLAGRLPRPFNLAVGPGRSLTYSETFLFNADYRFQIRTLAPRQDRE